MAVALFAMASLIEARDSDSDKHILRVPETTSGTGATPEPSSLVLNRLTEDYTS